MKLLAALASFALAVVVLWWLGQGPPQESGGAASRAVAEGAGETAGPGVELPTASDPASGAEARSAVVAETEVDAASAAARSADRVRLFGRVLELEGGAVVGATVMLWSWGAWREDVDPELAESVLLEGPRERRGFVATTNEMGRFELDVPVPTASRTSLEIEPAPMLERISQDFGGRRGLPPLLGGERDLGEFRLAPCGIVRGRVQDLAGSPLGGAEVKVASGRPYTPGIDGPSDAEGQYELHHVPTGILGVGAELAGFQSLFIEPFEVRGNEVNAGPTFTLEPARALAGRVVDEDGAGIVGAWVHAWPVSGAGGSVSTGVSEEQGRFRVDLEEPGVHALHVRAEGFQEYGRVGSGAPIEPDTLDLVIELERDETTRFRAFDAQTRAPITTFGLSIRSGAGRGRSSRGRFSEADLPTPRERETNEVEAAATPGLDLWAMTAPGYRGQQGAVSWDEGSAGVQTVWLEPGGEQFRGVRGRVDTDAPSAWQLELRAGFYGSGFASPRGPDAPASEQQRLEQLERFFSDPNASPVGFLLDDSGHFEVGGLSPGTYRLVGRGGPAGFVTVDGIRVTAEATVELGELQPLQGGAIEGRVLLAPELAGEWVDVRLGERTASTRTARTDADGRFVFEGVEPGVQALAILPRKGLIAEGVAQRLELGPGERAQVELDGRELGTVRLNVRVTSGGQPVEGLGMFPRPEDQRGGARALRSLPPTDAEGRTTGEVLGGGAVQLELHLGPLRHAPPEGRLMLPATGSFDAELELELTAGELALPAGLDLAGQKVLELELFEGDTPGAGVGCSLSVEIVDGVLASQGFGGSAGAVALLAEPWRLRLEQAPAGLDSFRAELWAEADYTAHVFGKEGGEPRVFEGRVERVP